MNSVTIHQVVLSGQFAYYFLGDAAFVMVLLIAGFDFAAERSPLLLTEVAFYLKGPLDLLRHVLELVGLVAIDVGGPDGA